MGLMVRPELYDLPLPAWFHHGERVLDLLHQYQPKNCVELGTYLGGSAIAIARTIRQWGGHLTCVDNWTRIPIPDSPFEHCRNNFVRHGVMDSITMMKDDTDHAAIVWDGGLIDFLYVDAGHEYESCKLDLVSWWPHLRSGGLFVGDDYERPEYGVTQAWDEFLKTQDQSFNKAITKGVDGYLIYGVKE